MMWERLVANSASQLLACGCQHAADCVQGQQLPHIIMRHLASAPSVKVL